MQHRLLFFLSMLLGTSVFGQFGTSNSGNGTMKSGFDSSEVSRDTARVEVAGLALTESGNRKLRPLIYRLDRFQYYLPVYQEQFINSTLGNNGTAIQDLRFRPQFNHGFNWGFNTFLPYAFDLKNSLFYDTQSPYTEATYTQGGRKEAYFKIRHTQNVGKDLNFGLEFQRVNSEGTYLRQAATQSALRLHAWYRPGNERYQALAAVVYHKGTTYENGGLTASSDSLFNTNTVSNRQLYEVNLSNALNKVFRNGFLIRQTFDLVKPASDSSGKQAEGAILRLQHSFQYNYNRHSYNDQDPVNAYYTTVVDSGLTFVDYNNRQWESEAALLKLSTKSDTSHSMHWEAKAFLKQQSVKLWMDYPIAGQNYSFNTFNQSVGGHLNYHFRPEFLLHVETEAFYAGFNSGDIQLAGDIQLLPSKKFALKIGTESYRQAPMYQQQRFVSNFGSWDVSLKKINVLKVYGELSFPKIHSHVLISNQLISNWVVLGQNQQPIQSNSAVNVLSLQLAHQFNVGKWHLSNRILVQQVNGADVIRLPLIQFQEGLFREGKIGKTTPWRIGIDVIGCSGFKANAYQSQSGLFYLQDTKTSEALIQANFYVSAKIRRARIFAQLEHFNAGMAGMQAYVLPYYPLPDRLLKIGFSWVFFD
jgi:hypothetical protein